MGEERRSRPLVAVRAIWDKDSISKYPDILRIPMEDGTVVNYRIDVQQPHPAFLTALEQIKNMPKGSYIRNVINNAFFVEKNAPDSDG